MHRPFRLVELMATLTKYKLEPKRMQLVYPFIDKEPNMVLIEACKGGNSRIRVERPLVVYERPGVYTEDVLEVVSDGVNVVMLWLGWLLREVLGHRRCAGWLGGSGGCGTSVGEGTAREAGCW